MSTKQNAQTQTKSPTKPLILIFGLIMVCVMILAELKALIKVDDEIGIEHNIRVPLPPFVVVTGASGNHFCPLQAWVISLHAKVATLPRYRRPRIIVYDLGLDNEQITTLNTMRSNGMFHELRKLEWSKYPSFWNISVNAGEYGWKTGIIGEVVRDYPGVVVWLDSGTLIQPDFFSHVDLVSTEYAGFLSPKSPSNLLRWTHPGVFEYFNDDPAKYKRVHNCNAAAIVFDYNVRKHLVDRWVNCGWVKDCIAPDGSSRENHRQDQALLTYLAAKEGLYCTQGQASIGIKVQRDAKCHNIIHEWMNSITPEHNETDISNVTNSHEHEKTD
ncbi:10536_t:CDS:2 [Paraglomus occultum]|uniref:10536_t:CDS:1 n=1 Tax=Paraglomus occultum TaxID=144539 RepID=A0A9N9BPD9_9GLOM|nr:10536_t:CDS:2 [Paraglomus occultum]